MTKFMLAGLVAAVAVPMAAAPADAQYRGWNERQEMRECIRELRNANGRQEYRKEQRECAREISRARGQDWRQDDRYDYDGSSRGIAHNERQEQRECIRELHDADNHREYRSEQRECAREISEARGQDWRQGRRYDYNRPPPGGNYYADNYYRDGRYYRERRLNANDRIYRGSDNRYYCRRSDGTTGLVVGAGAGALVGHSIDSNGSSILGTILGALTGGALGREVDRSSSRDLRCR